jgi:hypothetical protein
MGHNPGPSIILSSYRALPVYVFDFFVYQTGANGFVEIIFWCITSEYFYKVMMHWHQGVWNIFLLRLKLLFSGAVLLVEVLTIFTAQQCSSAHGT